MTRVRAASGGHTQLTLRRRLDVLDGIAFGRSDLAETVQEGDRVDVVARLASRTFGGYEIAPARDPRRRDRGSRPGDPGRPPAGVGRGADARRSGRRRPRSPGRLVTRRQAPARGRAPRDPYGIGPVSGYIGPAVAAIVLVVDRPRHGQPVQRPDPARPDVDDGRRRRRPGPGRDAGSAGRGDPGAEHRVPGHDAYAKAGNIWVQTATDVRQVTKTGKDSMPAFSADGQWIYFIRTALTGASSRSGGDQSPGYYDLETPALCSGSIPTAAGPSGLLTGSYSQGSLHLVLLVRQPTSRARTARRSR